MTTHPVPGLLRSGGSNLLVALAVLAAAVALSVVGLRGAAPAQTQQEVAHQIASGLRCPVCADLSAADSPAPLARQMRVQIAEKLARGESPRQIRDGFVAAYGSSVLMTPPREGVGQVVYVFPLLALVVAGLAGGLLLRRSLRRGRTGFLHEGPELSPAERRRVEQALEQLRREEP